MDNLLKQTPQVLTDEKTALFSLIDRFVNSVEEYRMAYNTITNNKNSDLQKRENDGKNALNRLATAQGKEKKELQDRLNAFTAGVNQNMELARKKALTDLDAVEADIAT